MTDEQIIHCLKNLQRQWQKMASRAREQADLAAKRVDQSAKIYFQSRVVTLEACTDELTDVIDRIKEK